MRKAVWAKEIVRRVRAVFESKHWDFEGKFAKHCF
jgi:hypothetical protein